MDTEPPQLTALTDDESHRPIVTGRLVHHPAASPDDGRRFSRRTFSRRAAGLVVGLSAGAAGLVGRLVAFTPVAEGATDHNCVYQLGGVAMSCWGPYSNFESRCYVGITEECVCECVSGCGTVIFRAHGIYMDQLCCCNY